MRARELFRILFSLFLHSLCTSLLLSKRPLMQKGGCIAGGASTILEREMGISAETKQNLNSVVEVKRRKHKRSRPRVVVRNEEFVSRIK